MSLRWPCWEAADDGIMVVGKEEKE